MAHVVASAQEPDHVAKRVTGPAPSGPSTEKSTCPQIRRAGSCEGSTERMVLDLPSSWSFSEPIPAAARARASAPWRPPTSEPLRRFSQGLLGTGLLDDLRAAGPHTLLAPVDPAFDVLPFSYEDLLFDERLVEARFDLFEYLVLRGSVEAHGPPTLHVTLHGEPVRLGGGLVSGRFGDARILRTFASATALVHVIDRCVFPVEPASYVVETESPP